MQKYTFIRLVHQFKIIKQFLHIADKIQPVDTINFIALKNDRIFVFADNCTTPSWY